MSSKKSWYNYDEGYSIGTVGADDGAIVRDEEHHSGARMTLEEETPFAPFSITCGVYGWMFHTRFFNDETEADEAFDEMRNELDRILESMPSDADAGEETAEDFAEELAMFVEMFP